MRAHDGVPLVVTAPRHPRRAVIARLLARALAVAERGYVVLALMLFSGALLPLLLNPGAEGVDDGNNLVRASFLAVYALLALAILARPAHFFAAALRHKLTIALIVLAVASNFWSVAPHLTLTRSSALLATTLFGIYLAARFSTAEMVRLLALALGATAVLSLLFGVLLPAYGISSGALEGSWRGVFVHKNILGRRMALAAIVFVLLARDLAKGRWLAWAGFGVCLALLLLSRSTSALAGLLVVLGLLPVFQTLRWRVSVAVPSLVTGLLVVAVSATAIVANLPSILGFFGKDLTLTGRVGLWSVLVPLAERELWLGHGYGAFWSGALGESGVVWKAVHWEVWHAHNGFLDLWLHLGLTGVILFVLGYAIAAFRAVQTATFSRRSSDLWPLALVTVLMMANLTESALLDHYGLNWVLYIAVACSAGGSRPSPIPLSPRRFASRSSRQWRRGVARGVMTSRLSREIPAGPPPLLETP